MVMNMISFRHVFKGMVLSAAVLAGGCATSHDDFADDLRDVPLRIQRSSCPVGYVRACADRLPEKLSCGCARREAVIPPITQPGRGI